MYLQLKNTDHFSTITLCHLRFRTTELKDYWAQTLQLWNNSSLWEQNVFEIMTAASRPTSSFLENNIGPGPAESATLKCSVRHRAVQLPRELHPNQSHTTAQSPCSSMKL